MLSLFAITLLVSSGQADDMVMNHIAAEASKAPPQALPDPTSKEEWETQRVFYLERLKESLNFPSAEQRAQWPLKAKFTRSDLEHETYTIKHVVFQSRPHWWVPANLWIPKEIKFPAPTVLYLHGHSKSGKSSYTQAKLNLVNKGYVVFCFDECGVGEREFVGQRGDQNTYLMGNNPCGLQAWDASRAIDYLHTIPQWVDTDRIAVYGRSGGGTQSFNVAAVDPRVDLAVIEEGMGSYSQSFIQPRHDNGGHPMIHTLDNYLVNPRRSFEQSHVLGLIAPRPVRINSGTNDIFWIPGVHESYGSAKKIYALYDKEQDLDLFELNVGHKGVPGFRKAAYRWLNKHFDVDGDAEDKKYPSPKAAELNCGLPDESDVDMTGLGFYMAKELPPAAGPFGGPKDLQAWQKNLRGKIWDEVMGYSAYHSERSSLLPTISQKNDRDTHWEELVSFTSEEGITVEAVFRYRKGLRSAPGIVVSAEPDDDVSALVDAGMAVLSVDVREFAQPTNKQDPEMRSWLGGVLLGYPLFAMKTWDMIRGIDYLETRSDIVDMTHIGTMGGGSTQDGMFALYAMALDTRVKAAAISKPLVSYRAAAPERSKWHDWSMTMYLSRILQYADVDQVAALAAPGNLMIADGRNTSNESLGRSNVQRILETSHIAWDLYGAKDRLQITGKQDCVSFFQASMGVDVER